MSTGTTIFLVALAVILAFGATMIWQTFHDTDRRRGSETDEDAIKRDVRQNRAPGADGDGRYARGDRTREPFDADDDIKPTVQETRRPGRHEFR